MNNIDAIREALDRIDSAVEKMDALQSLFNAPPKYDEKGVRILGVKLDNVYEDANSTITIAKYNEVTDALPMHIHNNSVQCLMVSKGKFLLKIDSGIRIMQKGDCALIPQGVQHTTAALEKDSEIIGICIPPENAYSVKNINGKTPDGHH